MEELLRFSLNEAMQAVLYILILWKMLPVGSGKNIMYQHLHCMWMTLLTCTYGMRPFRCKWPMYWRRTVQLIRWRALPSTCLCTYCIVGSQTQFQFSLKHPFSHQLVWHKSNDFHLDSPATPYQIPPLYMYKLFTATGTCLCNANALFLHYNTVYIHPGPWQTVGTNP